MSNREQQIADFLNMWNATMEAANKIEGFKWEFEVSIQSDDSLMEDRIKVINGINKSFTNNNMTYTTTNTFNNHIDNCLPNADTIYSALRQILY